MTREEAISMLKSKLDGHTDTSYEWCECVRMAIKALEQEPKTDNQVKPELNGVKTELGDCISRQTVLDINESHHGQMPNHVNHQIWQEIKELPSVTPQAPSCSPDPIITIDGIRYIAEEPKLKTVHKDGEVVIGGFKEIV